MTIPRFSLSHDTLPPADNAKYLKPLINGTSLQHDSARDAQSDGSPRMVTSTPPTVDHDSFGIKKSSHPPNMLLLVGSTSFCAAIARDSSDDW